MAQPGVDVRVHWLQQVDKCASLDSLNIQAQPSVWDRRPSGRRLSRKKPVSATYWIRCVWL